MCRIASLFLLQRLKGSMSGDACDFNNMETQAVIKFFFLQGKAPKEIHTILTVLLHVSDVYISHRQVFPLFIVFVTWCLLDDG